MDIQTMFLGLIGGFVLIFILFLVGGIWFMAGKEGRFFIRRFISRKGIDLINYIPLSKELVLSKIQWDGKYWVEDKESIMIGVDQEKGASTSSQAYNKAITGSGRWSGSRRPVLMATQEMFFVFSHGFLNMLKKATVFERILETVGKKLNQSERDKDIKEYKKKYFEDLEELNEIDKAKAIAEFQVNSDKRLAWLEKESKEKAIDVHNEKYAEFIEELELIKTLVNDDTRFEKSKSFVVDLFGQVQAGYEGVKILSIVTADEVNQYLEGAPSRILQEARLEGKAEGGLEMTAPTKGEGLPPMVKALAISASVIMALVIAYVVMSGGANPIDTIKGAIP